jgi:superfamily II DNA or RNA helicase
MSGLSTEQRLTLQQLRLLDWAGSHSRSEDATNSEPSDAGPGPRSELDQWKLTAGLTLAPWQREAVRAWFAAGRRGTIKVVTGAGKTIVALAVAERLQESDPDLRVAIVVPTIMLMRQWYEVLGQRASLPASAIGRLGGGYSDDFGDSRRILIAVLSSARKILPDMVRQAGIGDHLLLVADECHRVGAPEMSAVLRTPRSYALGLSATPEREDDTFGTADRLAGARPEGELGGIVYEMTFAQAVRDGILPPFELHHYGLPLNHGESRRYQALTRSINDARRELLAASSSARKVGSGEHLMTWARRASARASGRVGGLAASYVNDVTRRKQLLYHAESRTTAASVLVRQALAAREDARVILFHESIAEVVSLFELLARDKVPVVMEHSELPAELRHASLELFRKGTAQVIVSARSLIEGFDVPEADLGIIVASSSSPRQRIQSIGRVLRKPRGDTGELKASRICVLYIQDSVDEAIYERQDWDKLIGAGRSRYFTWDPSTAPQEHAGPPRPAIPEEKQIDLSHLQMGDVYPGRYEGTEYSADSLGNVSDVEGRIATNPQGVPERIRRIKGRPGRFRVTQGQRAILALVPGEHDGWTTVYAGTLQSAFQFGREADRADQVDVSGLVPGDRYLGPVEPATTLRYRQRAGGVIARRIPGGESFAHGPEADRLAAVLRELARSRRPISRILVNGLGHALWIEEGVPRFIGAIKGDLEFPGAAP